MVETTSWDCRHRLLLLRQFSDGNWVFLKPLPISKYVIYFKGGLKSIDAIAPSGSNSNYTFAGPCGCDFPLIT